MRLPSSRHTSVMLNTIRSYGWVLDKDWKVNKIENVGTVVIDKETHYVYHVQRIGTPTGVGEMWFMVSKYNPGKAKHSRTRPEQAPSR